MEEKKKGFKYKFIWVSNTSSSYKVVLRQHLDDDGKDFKQTQRRNKILVYTHSLVNIVIHTCMNITVTHSTVKRLNIYNSTSYANTIKMRQISVRLSYNIIHKNGIWCILYVKYNYYGFCNQSRSLYSNPLIKILCKYSR